MIQIIVVDDALTERTKAGGLLKRSLECEVHFADSGRSAVELVERNEPDLVVTDLNMPEMDGLELVRVLGNDYPDLPVIVTTAMGSEEIAAAAMRAGAASYVPKRRLAQDLCSTVQQVLAAGLQSATPARVLSHMDACQMQLRLRNDPALIQEAAAMMQRMLVCLPLGSAGQRTRVGLAIEAALSNAMLRGNLAIPADPNRSPVQLAALIMERATNSPWRDRLIHVSISLSRQRAEFTIRDEGAGFDVAAVDREVRRLSSDQEIGRGLSLMHTIMDSVVFNAHGNEVSMVKNRVIDDEVECDDE
jgi:CheY-like chemotaxis protein